MVVVQSQYLMVVLFKALTRVATQMTHEGKIWDVLENQKYAIYQCQMLLDIL